MGSQACTSIAASDGWCRCLLQAAAAERAAVAEKSSGAATAAAAAALVARVALLERNGRQGAAAVDSMTAGFGVVRANVANMEHELKGVRREQAGYASLQQVRQTPSPHLPSGYGCG